VCADIDDFREMAAGEDMAIRFYKKGDAAELAEQFIVILQSPELQRGMAEHNFAAGKEMSMTSVVKSYLRWFELHRYKRGMRSEALIPGFARLRPSSLRANERSPDWSLPWTFLAQRQNELDGRQRSDPAGDYAQVDDAGDAFSMNGPQALKGRSNGEGY